MLPWRWSKHNNPILWIQTLSEKVLSPPNHTPNTSWEGTAGSIGIDTLRVRYPGIYPWKGAAAGVQDVHSPETYHFPQFLEENSKITRYRSRMLEATTRCWNFDLKAPNDRKSHHNISISWSCDCKHSLRRWINLEETYKMSNHNGKKWFQTSPWTKCGQSVEKPIWSVENPSRRKTYLERGGTRIFNLFSSAFSCWEF